MLHRHTSSAWPAAVTSSPFDALACSVAFSFACATSATCHTAGKHSVLSAEATSPRIYLMALLQMPHISRHSANELT